MKKITRVKTINGHEYIYEITYYYDKKAKRTRQKSKYLGKNVDGKPVKIREHAKYPQKAYDLGVFLPYVSVIDELQIADLLAEDLSTPESRMVITIALAGLINPQAIYNLTSWYNGTVLSRYYPQLRLTSSTISRLLKKIGESDISQTFSARFIKDLMITDAYLYDLTLDIGGRTNSKNQYGFEFSGSDIQKNQISLIVDKEEGVPVMYRLRSGGGTKASVIRKDIEEISHIGIQGTTLVMDSSFFSTMNFYDLIFSNTPFIIPVSTQNSMVTETVDECSIDMMHPKKMMMYQNESLFVQPIIVSSAQAPIKGYLYYFPQQGDAMHHRFKEDIASAILKLDKTRVYAWMKPLDTVREIAGDYESFISWEEKDGLLLVKPKQKAISRYTKHFGKFVLLYAGKDFKWDECLALYREKREDERVLSKIISNLDIYPHNVNSEKVTRGILFISFISLLLKKKVQQILEESGLSSIYSYERLFLELEPISLIELANQKCMISALSRKQSEILSALQISPDIV